PWSSRWGSPQRPRARSRWPCAAKSPRYSTAIPDRRGWRESAPAPPTQAAGRECRWRARRIPTAPAAPRRRAAVQDPETRRSVSSLLRFFCRSLHQPLDAYYVILIAAVEQQRGAVARPRQRDRDDLLDAAGGARHHRDAVGEVYGLLDAVGHEQ